MSNKRNSIRKTNQSRDRKSRTPQEEFWAGEFGAEYTERNQGANWIASNTALFARILATTRNVRSIVEFGANLGLNLMAIRNLLPAAELAAVEINKTAVEKLRQLGAVDVFHGPILDYKPKRTCDFVLIKGVLIHINPNSLPAVYDQLYRTSGRYICIAEYYNPTPTAIPYRGHSDRLFKRDFAGEMAKSFPDLNLVDYGFVYRGDPNFPQDDITWFLFEKTT
jgi:pseudaminic acid biosynthesis-associated methylase